MSEQTFHARVRICGSTAHVSYEIDTDEVIRRRRSGLGAIGQLELLDALMCWPVGMPVAYVGLTDREHRILRKMPPGAVETTAEGVIRWARPAVTVHAATVTSTASGWRSGLRRAGQFAPFCARSLQLHSRPDDVDDLTMRAAFHGIGVHVATPDGIDQLVAPQPYVPQRHSAARWAFAEEIYRQVHESDAPSPARPLPLPRRSR